MADEIINNITDSVSDVVESVTGKSKGKKKGKKDDNALLWLGGAVAVGIFLWSRRGNGEVQAEQQSSKMEAPQSRIVENPPIPETPPPTVEPRMVYASDNFLSAPAELDPYYAQYRGSATV